MICLLILVIWVCLICENYQDTYLTIFALSLYKLYSHDTLEKKPLNAIGLWESLAGWQASQHPSLQTCWWPPFNSVSDRVADSGEVGQDPRRQHRWSLIILFLLEKNFFFPKETLNDSSWKNLFDFIYSWNTFLTDKSVQLDECSSLATHHTACEGGWWHPEGLELHRTGCKPPLHFSPALRPWARSAL